MNILNKNFEIQDYLRILYRRKWYFVTSFILVLAAGIYLILTRVPEYESFCIIQIKSSRLPSSLQRVVPGISKYDRYVSLKRQILKSTNLIKLIDKLKLHEGEKVRLNAAEMQKEMPEKSLDEIIQFMIIKYLRKNIYVRTLGNGELMIKVTAQSPQSAYQKVNTLLEIFMEDFLAQEVANVKLVKDFNYQQAEIFKKELEQAEKQLNKYKQELLNNQNIQNEILSKEALERINEAIVAIDITTKGKNEYLEYIREQLKLKGKANIEKYPKTPVINNLFSELEIKIDQMAALMKHYSWKSSEIIKVNNSINNIRNKIKNEIQKYYRSYYPNLELQTLKLIFENAISLVDLEIIKKKGEVLNQVVEASKNNTSINQANELTITKFEEKVEVNRNIYNLFLKQIQGTQIEESIQRANEAGRFTILEPPIEPFKATNEDVNMKLILIIFSASISGIGTIYLRELLDKSIKNIEEAEEFLQTPVLGILPYLQNDPLILTGNRKKTKGQKTSVPNQYNKREMIQKNKRNKADDIQSVKRPDKNKIVPYNKYYMDTPGSAEIERLSVKLNAMRNGNENQVILITSSVSGEGKSTVSSLLARSIALNRKKTLLIDFDIRRPRLHHIFNVPCNDGLTDFLRSQRPVSLCIKETGVPNLSLLSSGKLNEMPTEVINSDKIKTLFKTIIKQYDYIFVDSPPVVPVSDPLLLSKFVDNIILVLKAGSTPRYVVKRATRMFSDLNLKVNGIVLNNMQNVLPHYYDHRYLGYEYYNINSKNIHSTGMERKHGIWNWDP